MNEKFPLSQVCEIFERSENTNIYSLISTWMQDTDEYLASEDIWEIITAFLRTKIIMGFSQVGKNDSHKLISIDNARENLESNLLRLLKDIRDSWGESDVLDALMYKEILLSVLDKLKKPLLKVKIFDFETYKERREFWVNYEQIYTDICHSIESLSFTSMIVAYESNSVSIQCANKFIHIFNCFCSSVLKAEYLFDDKFSERKLNVVRSNVDELLKYSIDLDWNSQEESDVYDCLSLEDTIYKYENEDIINCFQTIVVLCEEYFLFNRKIDTFLENKDVKVDVSENQYAVYDRQYDDVIFQLRTRQFRDDVFLLLPRLFPFLFYKILRMNTIDHNFSVGNNELKELFELNNALEQVLELFETFVDLVKNDDIQFVSKKYFEDFLDVLKMVRIKNRYLIFKVIYGMEAANVIDYKLLSQNKLWSVSSFPGGGKGGNIQLCKDDFCLLQDGWKSALESQNISFQEEVKKVKAISSESMSYFADYEKAYIDVILSPYELEKFKILQANYMHKIAHSIGSSSDVLNYNKMLQSNIVHFCEIGPFIKRLGLQSEDKKVLMENVYDFLKSQKNDRMISCSFMIKFLQWVLDEINRVCQENKFNLNEDFRLVNLSDLLLIELEILVKRINDGYYSTNFASLFQDCFYTCKDRTISRLISESKNLDMLVLDEKCIFIASTWLPPIGKLWLNNKLQELKNKKKKTVARFYKLFYSSFFERANEQLNQIRVVESRVQDQEQQFQNQIKEEKKLIRQEEDETRRSMVQTLGVFAAFLALMTSTIQGFHLMKSPMDFLKILFGVVICLSVFVFLLNFIIARKDGEEDNKKQGCFQRNPLTILFGLMLLYLIAWIVYLYL